MLSSTFFGTPWPIILFDKSLFSGGKSDAQRRSPASTIYISLSTSIEKRALLLLNVKCARYSTTIDICIVFFG